MSEGDSKRVGNSEHDFGAQLARRANEEIRLRGVASAVVAHYFAETRAVRIGPPDDDGIPALGIDYSIDGGFEPIRRHVEMFAHLRQAWGG